MMHFGEMRQDGGGGGSGGGGLQNCPLVIKTQPPKNILHWYKIVLNPSRFNSEKVGSRRVVQTRVSIS